MIALGALNDRLIHLDNEFALIESSIPSLGLSIQLMHSAILALPHIPNFQ
jgi:hypothetical protein